MKNIYKVIKKIYTYVSNDFLFSMRFIFIALFDSKKDSVNFYSQSELVELIKQGKSIIRFGDGETALMLGESIFFQKFNSGLAKKLREIVKEYNRDSLFIVCVAQRYIQATNQVLHKKGLFRCWITSKAYFKYKYKKDISYGDAHMFYINGFFEEQIVPIIKYKRVIFVTKEEDMIKKKDLVSKYFKEVIWIIAPDMNSFESFDEVLEKVTRLGEKKDNTIVLVSTGPMGKVLTHSLSIMGIQAIDIGHGIITFFEENNSLEKVLV